MHAVGAMSNQPCVSSVLGRGFHIFWDYLLPLGEAYVFSTPTSALLSRNSLSRGGFEPREGAGVDRCVTRIACEHCRRCQHAVKKVPQLKCPNQVDSTLHLNSFNDIPPSPMLAQQFIAIHLIQKKKIKKCYHLIQRKKIKKCYLKSN